MACLLIMKRIFILVSIFTSSLFSQSLSGIIIDLNSKRPLVGCNITIDGTNRGAITNNEGFYFLNLPHGKLKIIFQFIGYKSDTLSIIAGKGSIKKDILLIPQPFISDEIIVFAGKYSQAEQLILRASREKKENLRLVQNYSCKSYTKTSISGWADSLKDKYAMILEAYSELTWNAPNDWHEVIKSLKTTANLPHSVGWFNGSTFIDINADRIQFAKKVIVGPTAPDAIEYYNYEIIDTLYQDERRIFKMRIKPKDSLRPLMSGHIFLIDNLFLIQKVDVLLNRNSNYDMFEDIHVVQQYKPFKGNIYLPYYSYRESVWNFALPKFPKMRYKKTNFREGYQINVEENSSLKGITKIEINESIPFDSVEMNIPPLSQSEIKGYAKIDSLVDNVPVLKLMTGSIKLIDYFSGLQKLPLGVFSDFYRFNRVEGNFIGLAFDSKNLSKPFHFKVAFGHGFSDERNKFLINPNFSFMVDKAVLRIGFSHFNMLKSREDKTLLPVWYNTFQSVFENIDYFDYYYSQGVEIKVGLQSGPYNFKVSLFDERHKSAKQQLRHGLFSKNSFIENAAINEGQNVGYKVQIGYSSIAYKESSLAKREIRNRGFIDFELSLEKADRKFNGDFDYQKINTSIAVRQNTFYSGFMDLTLLASFSTKNLPTQKLNELESGFEGYQRFRTFRTLDQNASIGRNKVALFFEHNFHNSLFRFSQLPFIEDLNYDLLFLYNVGWAGNKDFEKLTSEDLFQETGFGIGRIFNFFQLDFLWRLQRFSNSQNFVFSFRVMEIEF
jgi:Family of unknown function (DUF5686)/CarboxypepD_reg-like domain